MYMHMKYDIINVDAFVVGHGNITIWLLLPIHKRVLASCVIQNTPCRYRQGQVYSNADCTTN